MAKKRKSGNAGSSGRSIREELADDKKSVDKKLSKNGLTYGSVVGAIILIVGVLLIIFNIVQVLEALVGIVLVYFGLKMLGWKMKV